MGANHFEHHRVGSRLGVPNILLDPFSGPVSSTYLFRWLFESTEYVLGELVTPARRETGGHTVNDLLEAVWASVRGAV